MYKIWTPSEVSKLFKITKAKTSLLRDEASGIIPGAERVKRGKTYVRSWKVSDLPDIGKVYGFLKQPNDTKIIATYTAKGGVLKTTISYNLAKLLALNGIKTLVIGLDIQCSITDLLANYPPVQSIEDIITYPGLYEVGKIINNKKYLISDVIQHTNLPTLDFIPESTDLGNLEDDIKDEKTRHHFINNLIKPIKNSYQVIIFDNGPSWNFLIKNSLVAATSIISPLGCDIGTYKSVTKNLGIINNYKKQLELNWEKFIIIPTLLEKNKLSRGFEAQYRNMYAELITATSIRRSIKGQESVIKNLSIIESDPTSPLANDYYEAVIEIWDKVIGKQK